MNDLLYPLRTKVSTATAPKTDTEKLHDYLIDRNREGVKKVLLLNGYTGVSTLEEMQRALLSLIRTKGEKAIAQLIEEHPDYGLIVEDYKVKNPAPVLLAPSPKRAMAEDVIRVDFNAMIQLLMFLTCVWLVLKIFKQ